MSYRIEKNSDGNPEIVIDGWDKGIADSALKGLQDVRCVNIQDAPGVFYTSPETITTAVAPGSQATTFGGFIKTFTADAGTDIITFATYPTSINADYIAVQFTTTGTLPAGLSLATTYYIVIQTATTFKVSTTYANALAGTFVDITDAGTGTHTATSINMSSCSCATVDPRTGNIYTVDSAGRVWFYNSGWILLNGNTLTNGSGNGIAIYQDWLFIFRNRLIDVYGPLSSVVASQAWYNGWKTINQAAGDASRHDVIIGQDDTLYWTDYDSTTAFATKGYVGSLRPVAGQLLFQDTGNPTTSSSTTNYTFNSQALDFPVYEQPVALEEINRNLVIAVNGYNIGFTKGYSKLYTWDRVSASFDSPLYIPDNPVVEMINYNNVIYIFTGKRGRIYRTNLATVELATKIPDSMFVPDSATVVEGNPLRASENFTFSSNVAVARNKIFFGISGVDGGSALYSYDPENDVLKIENRAVIGTYGLTATALTIPCVIAPGSTLNVYFSFGYNSVFGWDLSNPFGSTDSANTFYSYIITDMIPVATKTGKRAFAEVEWRLDTPMGPTDAVRISYRKSSNVAFTTIDSTSYSAGLVPQISAIYDANIADAEELQFKIEISSTSSSGSTGVRFKELRVR